MSSKVNEINFNFHYFALIHFVDENKHFELESDYIFLLTLSLFCISSSVAAAHYLDSFNFPLKLMLIHVNSNKDYIITCPDSSFQPELDFSPASATL